MTQNKLQQLLAHKTSHLLSIFITAGYPHKESLKIILSELEKADVDFIEIGIPFSDPLADGLVIQESNMTAIQNGMTLALLFEQLHDLKNTVTKPIILMGYLNPVLQFGVASFYAQCFESGVSGIILPDLPLDEFKQIHQPFIEKYNLSFNFLITPTTSSERILKLDTHTNGFLYLVSSNATTGNSESIMNKKKIRSVAKLPLKNKLMMGFGIKNKDDFNKATSLVNGAIIGTEFIKALKTSGNIPNAVQQFISSIK